MTQCLQNYFFWRRSYFILWTAKALIEFCMPALQTTNVRPGQWKIVYRLLIQYQRCYGYCDNFETKLLGE